MQASDFIREYYLKRGLILIDIFIIIGLIQYFVFDGSLNNMLSWFKGMFQYLF